MPKAAKKSSSKSRSRRKRAGKKGGSASDGRSRAQGPESLEQLRELLFGAERREAEARGARLEELVRTELDAIRTDADKRIAALTARLDKELESAQRRWKSLSARVTRVAQSFDEKLAEARKRATKSDTAARTAVSARFDELRDELDGRYQELTEALSAELDEFRNSRPDRSDLSQMFGEFARQLSGRAARRKT